LLGAAAATAISLLAAAGASAATLSSFSSLNGFAISHDGTKLALAGTLNGVQGLYESDGNGADVILLVAEGAGFYAFEHPSFSPNGKTIAFSAFGKAGGGDVYTISAAGGKAKDLTNSSGIDEENPSYSPDGTHIVAASADAASSNTVSELRTIDAKTGVETLILNNYPKGVGEPAYSSDGANVLFAEADGSGETQIASIPVAGGSSVVLTSFTNGNSASDPISSSASSNAGQIAFFVNDSTIYTMNSDGSGITPVQTDSNPISEVAWTPTGQIAHFSVNFGQGSAQPVVYIPPAVAKITTTTTQVETNLSVAVSSQGYPAPALSQGGSLPNGLTFVDNGDGTGSLSGQPQPGSGGSYAVTITATNGSGSSSQTFTLKVDEAPSITSQSSYTATAGKPASFHVTATGFPNPKLSESGILPAGVVFHPASGTFTGKPAAQSVGSYQITLTATNSSGSNTQTFTLTVQP
jgi:dipeptidyl aminopeptidase/acylaminoacyl peptidase